MNKALVGYGAFAAIIGALWGLPKLLGRVDAAEPEEDAAVVAQMQQAVPHRTRTELEAVWQAIKAAVPPSSRALMLSLSFQESRWDAKAVGDGGASVGLFQLGVLALEDVRTFHDSSFPVLPADRSDPFYNARGGYGYFRVNMKGGRAAGDVELALAMNRTGPQRAEAEKFRWWGKEVRDRAKIIQGWL